jgi:hypothetical protein
MKMKEGVLILTPEARLAQEFARCMMPCDRVPTEAEADLLVRSAFGVAKRFMELGQTFGYIRVIDTPDA